MAGSQVPWGVNALGGSITAAAWRTKPSWHLVTTEDRMIPPSAQRSMAERTGAAVTEVTGSHATPPRGLPRGISARMWLEGQLRAGGGERVPVVAHGDEFAPGPGLVLIGVVRARRVS